jgi:hypothetical protein
MKLLALVTLVVVSVGCGRAVSGESVVSPQTFADPSPVASDYPSPSPTKSPKPKPVAIATPPKSIPRYTPLPQTDCTKVVYHSFTAILGPGLNDIQLAWRTSGACAPVHGYIAGQYFAWGRSYNWEFHITAASGTHMDVVKRPTLTGPCTVTIAYTLVIQGSAASAFTSVANAYICPT